MNTFGITSHGEYVCVVEVGDFGQKFENKFNISDQGNKEKYNVKNNNDLKEKHNTLRKFDQ